MSCLNWGAKVPSLNAGVGCARVTRPASRHATTDLPWLAVQDLTNHIHGVLLS